MTQYALKASLDAEQAWNHAEENHISEQPDNASLRIDYLRAIAAELRALRIARETAGLE